ncbi:unnamed protein product [Durusdinium trenchii]|uniref:Serine/threonine-protein kinase SIK3 homolog (Serine/threonine-protein kinase QSK homolog) n=2 Tax=Durusdinium trenchii TaxID=1381693 RepID=A0ABP0MYK3_9DINO
MGRHDEKRRSYGEEKERSPQRYRESAEERGLAAAARLAAAVAAATHGDPKFRLRRHSAIGCSPSSPQAPFHAWKEPKEKSKETPKENGRRCEHDERRDERPERPERQRRASPTRPPRAQSARRPARLDPPARARSADPRRRYEAAFVPEGTEEVAAEVPPVLEFKAPAPPSTAGTAQSPRHAARRSTGHILTAAVNAAAGRRSCTNMSVMDQQPKPFKNLSSKIFSGAYIMEKFLGRGASASVWEAIRSDNHQRVAVKVFDQGQRDKRQAHREMKVLARVRHPRIVQAFEVVETPRLAQLVCEAIKQSERFQKLQERTSVVVASAAEGVKRAREKIGRPASAIEFEAQLENRAKSTRTVPAIAEMHKSWAQNIVASVNKEGPRVSEGEHELGFKEMFLQSRALENSLEVIISEASLREHYTTLPTADDTPVAYLHDLLSKTLAFPAVQWQGLIQVAMSGVLSSEEVAWILSIVTAMKNDWNDEMLSSERKDLAMKAEVLKQELKPLALSDTEEHSKKRIELSTQLLQTYLAVQQNLHASGAHRDEVRQMRESDIQHVLQQVQARMVSLQSQAESSSSQRKDLEGELSQSQESLKMQLSHLDEVRAQIDKEIEELDERKRQLRIELDTVSRQLDEARMKQKEHMEKSDKHRSELYNVKASIQEKINGAESEAVSSGKEKELLDQTRKILEDSGTTLQTSVQEQQGDLKQKLVDFQEHFKALLADHLRFCEVKARQLQAQAEASVTEANKELLLATARSAEEAFEAKFHRRNA